MSFGTSLLEGIALTQMTLAQAVMILISLILMYLAVAKGFEPLLLIPISFGMMISNVPIAGLSIYDEGGLMYYIYQGVRTVVYPPMIFLGIGIMTDFGPLIANPKSALIGFGSQIGIFTALGAALLLGLIPGFEGFSIHEAASIGIIGGADGPTAIFVTSRFAPELLSTIAIAAYSYMALVPIIQPPIMKLLTTKKERIIVMPEPKKVTQKQKIIFPIVVTLVILLLLPAAGTLVAMLMLGNLIRESGVVDRYVRTFSNDVLNVLTLLIGLAIGASATAERFLTAKTILIVVLGLFAFSFGTVGGILVAKLLCKLTNGKVNPLIGNSGVSAMPMSARTSQKMGQLYNPENHLLMHAMGPLVAGVIGSAMAAGILISWLG